MHLPRGVSEVTFFNLIAHSLLSKLWTGVRHSRSFLDSATANFGEHMRSKEQTRVKPSLAKWTACQERPCRNVNKQERYHPPPPPQPPPPPHPTPPHPPTPSHPPEQTLTCQHATINATASRNTAKRAGKMKRRTREQDSTWDDQDVATVTKTWKSVKNARRPRGDLTLVFSVDFDTVVHDFCFAVVDDCWIDTCPLHVLNPSSIDLTMRVRAIYLFRIRCPGRCFKWPHLRHEKCPRSLGNSELMLLDSVGQNPGTSANIKIT